MLLWQPQPVTVSTDNTTTLNAHDLLLLQEGTVEDTMDTDEVTRVLTAMLGSDGISTT